MISSAIVQVVEDACTETTRIPLYRKLSEGISSPLILASIRKMLKWYLISPTEAAAESEKVFLTLYSRQIWDLSGMSLQEMAKQLRIKR